MKEQKKSPPSCRSLLLLAFLLLSWPIAAEAEPAVTGELPPEFPLGKAPRRGLLLHSPENRDRSLPLGARIQGTVEARQAGGVWIGDFYGRRIRFEVTAQFTDSLSFVLDLRNDQANRGDGGERNFVVGNAYVFAREIFGLSFLNFQAFRSKVDVSRATTVSSGQQLYYERPMVTEFAQQYVSHNRRAANLQLFGTYQNKIRYFLVVGDGVASATFLDAKGKMATSVARQDPMFGAKVILSPIPGWEEKERTSTYFGQGKHVSAGAGFFRVNAIFYKPSVGASEQRADRSLFNLEGSFLLGPFFLQAEFLHFFGMVEDFAAATPTTGDSSGWYVTGEYVLTNLGFLAPMFRYENWNRFRQTEGYGVQSAVLGINWYLIGNSARAGLMWQRDWLGSQVGAGTEDSIRFISQFHF